MTSTTTASPADARLLTVRRWLTLDAAVSAAGRALTAVWLAITYAYILFAAVFVVYLSLREDPLVLTSPLSLKWFVSTLTWGRFLTAMTASLTIAAVVTVCACVVGTCAAIAITRYRFPGSQTLMSLFMAPLALPQMVLAIGIMLLYTRIAAGSGFRLTNTVLGLVIAHTVVTVPWTIRTIGSVLVTLGRDIERAAQGLGASPFQTFLYITLPLLYRGMLAGGVFAFVISFGNLELSLMIYPPSFEPLPVMMYDQVRGTPDYRIAAIATITMVIVGSAIALVDRLAGIDRAL